MSPKGRGALGVKNVTNLQLSLPSGQLALAAAAKQIRLKFFALFPLAIVCFCPVNIREILLQTILFTNPLFTEPVFVRNSNDGATEEL